MGVTQSYKKSPNYFDLLIIGGGPAGLTASIYAKRDGLKVAFFERDTPGGKITRTAFIENYPGFEKIEGYNLALHMLKQATNLGVEFKYGNVVSITKDKDTFILKTEEGTNWYSRAIILATGMKERKLGCPGEDKLFNKGVSYCAICDGAFYKDQIIVVVGGGNSAFEEAQYLSCIASKVYIIHRRDEFKADKIAVQHAMTNPKIEIITNSIVKSINGKDHVESITISNVINNEEKELEARAIFPFIGFTPTVDFTTNLPIEKTQGFIVVNDNMETNIPGLFSAGDINKKNYRQISTAVSDGTIAALNAYKYIRSQDNE